MTGLMTPSPVFAVENLCEAFAQAEEAVCHRASVIPEAFREESMMTARIGKPADPPIVRPARRDRTIQEARHDVYQARGKFREPTACPRCGAVFHKGRWIWGNRPADAHESTCPACERINGHNPAGFVTLTGPFLAMHRGEILGLIHNEAAKAGAEHPLARLIAIEEKDETVSVSTTDVHLAQGIGDALRQAYQGRLTLRYSRDQQLIRVRWER